MKSVGPLYVEHWEKRTTRAPLLCTFKSESGSGEFSIGCLHLRSCWRLPGRRLRLLRRRRSARSYCSWRLARTRPAPSRSWRPCYGRFCEPVKSIISCWKCRWALCVKVLQVRSRVCVLSTYVRRFQSLYCSIWATKVPSIHFSFSWSAMKFSLVHFCEKNCRNIFMNKNEK